MRWVDTGGAELGHLLGLDTATGPEAEDAVCLLALEPWNAAATRLSWRPQPEVLEALQAAPLRGEPSWISERHRDWPGVPSMAHVTQRRSDATPPSGAAAVRGAPLVWPRQVLRRRRSRSVYEDRPLEHGLFSTLIDRIVGEGAGSSFPWCGDLATLLFIHRVEGLEPGLYAATDAATSTAELRPALRSDFPWRPEATGPGWRLLLLSPGDARGAATHLAGRQSAAGDGAFTALFLARFAPLLHSRGPFTYRRLHWLVGELGHRLYLEAEAQGLGATGLGGFFDDQLCTLLGLRDDSWRPLYLLAVGHRAGEDPPLEPPYAHHHQGAEPLPASRGGFRLTDK